MNIRKKIRVVTVYSFCIFTTVFSTSVPEFITEVDNKLVSVQAILNLIPTDLDIANATAVANMQASGRLSDEAENAYRVTLRLEEQGNKAARVDAIRAIVNKRTQYINLAKNKGGIDAALDFIFNTFAAKVN